MLDIPPYKAELQAEVQLFITNSLFVCVCFLFPNIQIESFCTL